MKPALSRGLVPLWYSPVSPVEWVFHGLRMEINPFLWNYMELRHKIRFPSLLPPHLDRQRHDPTRYGFWWALPSVGFGISAPRPGRYCAILDHLARPCECCMAALLASLLCACSMSVCSVTTRTQTSLCRRVSEGPPPPWVFCILRRRGPPPCRRFFLQTESRRMRRRIFPEADLGIASTYSTRRICL